MAAISSLLVKDLSLLLNAYIVGQDLAHPKCLACVACEKITDNRKDSQCEWSVSYHCAMIIVQYLTSGMRWPDFVAMSSERVMINPH